ncbi:MAG TPA: hypothetical protein DCF33_17095, partial [Saprospirales bacterium]|nr:hypothetical protein [Saprospirales bacterium]
MSSSSRTPHQPDKAPVPYWLVIFKKVLRRVENLLFVLVIILTALYFILQLPFVQNWLVHKTTRYLSETLETRVELKRVDIEFFDNIVLDGLYVEDLNGDTLLYAQKFSAGLSGNFFSVLWNRLEFSEISLSHARVYLIKKADQRQGNLNALLARLDEIFGSGQPKKKKKQAPFFLRIQNLNLHDVQFSEDRYTFREGEIRRKLMSFSVDEGNVKVNLLDLSKNVIDVRSVMLDGFQFVFEKERIAPPEGFIPYIKPVALKTDTLKLMPTLQILVGQLTLQNSGFKFDNFRNSAGKQTPDEVMDYDHLDIQRMDAQAEKLEIYVGEKPAIDDKGLPTTEDIFDIFGSIKHLTATEKSGLIFQWL